MKGERAMPTPPSSSRPAPTEALLWGTTGILGGGGGGRFWAGWGTAGWLLAGGSWGGFWAGWGTVGRFLTGGGWGGFWAGGPELLTSTGPMPKSLAR